MDVREKRETLPIGLSSDDQLNYRLGYYSWSQQLSFIVSEGFKGVLTRTKRPRSEVRKDSSALTLLIANRWVRYRAVVMRANNGTARFTYLIKADNYHENKNTRTFSPWVTARVR